MCCLGCSKVQAADPRLHNFLPFTNFQEMGLLTCRRQIWLTSPLKNSKHCIKTHLLATVACGELTMSFCHAILFIPFLFCSDLYLMCHEPVWHFADWYGFIIIIFFTIQHTFNPERLVVTKCLLCCQSSRSLAPRSACRSHCQLITLSWLSNWPTLYWLQLSVTLTD